MPWSEILSHQPAIDRFQKSVERNRLASTYLFVGSPGIGKRTFALTLAEVLLCENAPEGFDSCGVCPACQQVRSASHPDLILLSKPADKAFIPVEAFIGDKEHRRREGLCHDIGLKPFRGGKKIAIVDDADFLNQEGANSLLKTLEEPPPNSLLILIGSSEQRQLSTIVSRSQVVRFSPLSQEEVTTLLQRATDLPESENPVPIESLALASGGSMELAKQLADPETYAFRQELFRQLASCDPNNDSFGKTVLAFVDGAGKDGAKKRRRLSLVADFAITFFRHWYIQVSESENRGIDPSICEVLETQVQKWRENDPDKGAEIAIDAIDRCIELQRQIRANVNQANAVEGWLIDLGRLTRGQALMQL